MMERRAQFQSIRRSSPSKHTRSVARTDEAENVVNRERYRIVAESNDLTKRLCTDQTTQTSSVVSVENACWFVAALIALYLSDICNVLLFDQRIHRPLMLAALTLIGINLLIAAYLIGWLTHVRRIEASAWHDHNPVLIPLATASFITGSILLIVSLWPVYIWFTAPLLFTIFMGFIVVAMSLPKWI